MNRIVVCCNILAMKCCGHSFFSHQWSNRRKGMLCSDCPKDKRLHDPIPYPTEETTP